MHIYHNGTITKKQAYFLPVWGFDANGRGKNSRKRCRRVNIMEIIHTHACQCKNETIIFCKEEEGGLGRMMEGVNSIMIYYRTFVNVTMYPCTIINEK
jgi:hypothetical protein